jgi:hypothetical protein
MKELSYRTMNLLVRQGLAVRAGNTKKLVPDVKKLRELADSYALQTIPGVGSHIERELLDYLDKHRGKEDPESLVESGSVEYMTPQLKPMTKKELWARLRETEIKMDTAKEELALLKRFIGNFGLDEAYRDFKRRNG